MNLRDDGSTVSHRRGNTFGRSRADVPRTEHAAHACFMLLRPRSGAFARKHEAVFVDGDAASVKPRRVGRCTGKQEHVFRGYNRPLRPAQKLYFLERPGASQRGDLSAVRHIDIVQSSDTVDEILRLTGLQALSTYQHANSPRARREVHGGLSRGVSAADQQYVLSRAKLRLDRRSPIVCSWSLEAFQALNVGSAISRARSDNDRSGPDGHGGGQA